jgi:hypothetical protein
MGSGTTAIYHVKLSISYHCGNWFHFSNTTHTHRSRDSCRAPRKRSAAMANTIAVLHVRHRGIDTVLRCAAKTNTPPSTRRHHVLSNDLQGLVWDKDADTPIRRALQNGRATRLCIAERHTAVRSACWSLTPAAREFASTKTSLHCPCASAKARARFHTRGAPELGTTLCAKATSRIHTRGVPGPGSSSLSTPCPTLSSR